MVSTTDFQLGQEYVCTSDLDIFKTPHGHGLVTQAKAGRHLRFTQHVPEADSLALPVCLCEDDYPGWLSAKDWPALQLATSAYQPPNPSATEISDQLPAVIEFTKIAMNRPNLYLWGGTVGPDFDCSGLIQAAFASVGVMLPRDSYQQEHFVEPVHLDELRSGDLLFFGKGDRTTHVALHLGDGTYIHSSGKDQGRNGIGIDSISELADPVSQAYFQQLRGAGRVTCSYQPTGAPMFCY